MIAVLAGKFGSTNDRKKLTPFDMEIAAGGHEPEHSRQTMC